MFFLGPLAVCFESNLEQKRCLWNVHRDKNISCNPRRWLLISQDSHVEQTLRGNTGDGVAFDRHAIETISGVNMLAFGFFEMIYFHVAQGHRPCCDCAFVALWHTTKPLWPNAISFPMFYSNSRRKKNSKNLRLMAQSMCKFQFSSFKNYSDFHRSGKSRDLIVEMANYGNGNIAWSSPRKLKILIINHD